MLYLGLPEYRLPAMLCEAQVREILSTGDITLKLEPGGGRDFTYRRSAAGLRLPSLIAVGAHRSRRPHDSRW